ncbi:PAS domain S-box protein [Hyphobacterium sp. CCMP332]|nr:PAS domain S-box protein [Hyphobacterium sp. CCMP332]
MNQAKERKSDIFSFLSVDRKYTRTREGHQSIRVFNILAFSFILFYLITAIPFLFTEAYKVGLFLVFESSLFALTISLTKRGKFILAKNCISIALMAGILTLGGVLGPDGFAHILFFPLVISLFIIFNKYEILNRNIFIIISIVQFFIMEFYPIHYYDGPALGHDQERVLEFWIFLVSFIANGAAVYYFLIINLSYRTRLKSNEKRFRFISENSKDIIALLNKNCKVQYVSPSIEELLGYQADEVESKGIDQFIHSKDRYLKNEILKDGKGELRLISKNNNTIWFDIVISEIDEDNFSAYQLSIRDISDRKRVEYELQNNRSLIERIAETTPNFLYVFHHKEKKISYLNRSIWDYLEYDMNSLFRMDEEDFHLIHPDDKDLLEKNYNTLKNAKEGKVVSTEYRMKNASGRWIWFESRDTVLEKTPDGKDLVLSLGEARDITQNKENEEFLLKKQEELRKAKHLAEEASEAKAQFLSTMSHEIRTPLNSVIGMTNLLSLEDPKPEQIENLKALSFGAESLMALINDILDFSKIEAGGIKFESTSFNLEELLKNVVESFKVLSRDKNLEIKFEINENLPQYIKGDPTRLGQILNNLIGNAIKFTNDGYVKLSAKKLSEQDNSARIAFIVEDTGIGIPKEKQEIIFDSFSQASSETTRKYGGTGLGLAITKKLVDLQKGKIQLSSALEKGTTFIVEIDYVIDESGKDLKKPVEEEITDLENHHLLLVEDNKMNQIVARKFLDKWKITFDIAENGLEAVEMVRKNDYDLVLMDLHMPEMDGYEATKHIREMDNEKRKLPVIALSASTGPDAEEKIVNYGMNGFVMKPFDPKVLFNTIKINVEKLKT